jgi:hypothetical protein
MRRLSLIIYLFSAFLLNAQSPHGKNFNLDCGVCHNSKSWVVNNNEVKFDHSRTKFSLSGQHEAVSCKMCHVTLKFSEAKTQCFECHKDIHANTVGPDCERCHETSSWLVSDVNKLHQSGRFPLLGKHLAAQCEQCHFQFDKLQFPVQGVQCFDCHSADYYSAKSPDHVAGNFSYQCQDCHNFTDAQWNISQFNHDFFPLVGGHNIKDCFSCHKQNQFAGLSMECISCHQANFESAKNPDHIANNFPVKCENCHNINSWQPASFNHNLTNFPLTGAHLNQQCSVCHQNGYTAISSDCYSCHKTSYDNSQNPNHISAGFPASCQSCHTTTAWSPASFDHNSTKFPLTGSHVNVQCSACHQNSYANISTDCYSCHKSNYDNTNNPNHNAAGFSTDCQTCHNTTAWQPATFDHDGQYFPIYSGSHNNRWNACTDCHTNNSNYSVFSCITCHDHNQTDTDNQHQGIQGYVYLSNACYSCHPRGSSDGSFNHATSIFPLTGAHTIVDCAGCHTNGYAGTPTDCVACHQVNYNNTSNPNHTALALSTDCSTCHTTNTGWRPAQFPVHSNYFAFTGAHTTIANDCASCHNGTYTNTPKTCVGCHQNNYNGTTNPPHASTGFSTDCQACHTTTAWQPATFDHDGQYFPIYSGSHNNRWNTCADCHTNSSNYLVFSCITCHEHNKTDMDNEHRSIQGYEYLSDACYSCHPRGRSEGSFNHATSVFPLTGAHTTVECAGCHANGYSGTPVNCVACHQANYNSTNNPSHTVLALSTDCSTCHTTNSGWKPAQFPIHNNYFAFTGAHTTIANDCSSCHNGNYTNTSKTCVGCHQLNYNNTTNPSHSSLALSTDCSTCHTTNSGWKPAQFPIHSNYFALTGAHAVIANDCSNCHNGDYVNTPKTCVGCHQTNYNSTNNPPHVSMGFSTDCQTCHTTTAWQPATFDHDAQYFPVYSGSHNGKWNTCSDCHTNSTNYNVFSCTICHEHNQTDTDNDHRSVQGYVYSSSACFSCHPKGTANGSFNHATSVFPLTGAHSTITCVSCHVNGYAGTPTSCISCHQANYNSTTNPSHTSLSLSTDCSTCHTTNAGWKPAQFPIHSNYFALTGVHTTLSCTTCHNGNYTNTPQNCIGCHQTNYNNTTNPNHSALALSTDCSTCHTTNAGWRPALFPVHNNYFALTGAHTSLTCANCHNGNYYNTSNTCIGCHQTDYNSTTNPQHSSAGFPTDCESCHNTVAWQPSTFNHDAQYFPIYSGRHRNRWSLCSDCHQAATNFSVHSCNISCHRNDHHQDQDCYICHPTGNGDIIKNIPSIVK